MSLNWNNIRPIHNSLNEGFEELVCQLASKETFAGQQHFQRIGKPDAGKESFWEMTNGDLYMWQAKYFTQSLSEVQWRQIDDSITQAVDNHPKLVKYFVCMPLDMPDGRVRGKKSMLDKWLSKIEGWQTYAAERGITLEIDFWGSSELISRLSKRENEGLQYFWFNREEFSDEWISERNEASISALGARYTKELNFELPIAKIFDGLSRDGSIKKQLDINFTSFLKKYRSLSIKINEEPIKRCLVTLEEGVTMIKALYKTCLFSGIDSIPFEDIVSLLEACQAVASEIENHLYMLRRNIVEKNPNHNQFDRPFVSDLNDIAVFSTSISSLIKLLKAPACSLANRPFLLISGPAGIGKSHLIADVVEKRKSRGQSSLLLLGENFHGEEMVWTQILRNQLRKPMIDEFVFLGALNAKAKSEGARLVIFIDAINEGNGSRIWPKQLVSFIKSFANYPWLGLVLSYRNSFKSFISDLALNNLVTRIEHIGFAGVEYAAVKSFFNHYKLLQPTIPFLNYEFQNPLFLKLFCRSIAERGLREAPSNLDGITSIFNYFLATVNIKLAQPDALYFDEKKALVGEAVKRLLKIIINSGQDFVPYATAELVVQEVFNGQCSNSEPYLKRLLSEGVLNLDSVRNEHGESDDVIYFAYQRFQDHLTIAFLLDEHLDESHPEASFQQGKLHALIMDDEAIYDNHNLIEALSIQLPERVGKELIELASFIKDYYIVAQAFIQSLAWRRNESINEGAMNYVDEVIMRDGDLADQFGEAVLLSSMKPQFYFNADWMHKRLMELPLPARDADWTIWLQNKFNHDEDNFSAVKRIIDYAWNEEDDQNAIGDESIMLGCITLGWFFTSSNRYLRDAATKALVCQLQNRLHLIPLLLEKFALVNDPYVLERLYAASYGAVMRASQHNSLGKICEYVFNSIFNQKEIYPNILLRDYARGIIEYTLFLGFTPNVDIQKVRPPYKSELLPTEYLSIEAIDELFAPKNGNSRYGGSDWGIIAILDSMTTEYGRGIARYGDFGRYTFQRAFRSWEVDSNGLSNYAIELVFKLGYDPELFSEFDQKQGTGRGSGHKERIGKKYQWIVFFELLARVSDQCSLKDESNWEDRKATIPYGGPWNPSVRDIDPTILIKETKNEGKVDEIESNWWSTVHYSPWDKANCDWLKDRSDCPLPEQLLEVTDKMGNVWLWLELHPNWAESEPLGEDKYQSPRKVLWYQMRSYLVKKEDYKTFSYSFRREIRRRDLPEARNLYTIFDREYYWSTAFDFFDNTYYGGGDWIDIHDSKTGKWISKIHRTTEFFNWEEEFDCSKELPIQFYKPTRLIWDSLSLSFSKREGELINKKGEMICFDPSVHNNSKSGLLVRKKDLVTFLDERDLILLWGIIGEKQIQSQGDAVCQDVNRLNISGLYELRSDGIKGNLSFKEE